MGKFEETELMLDKMKELCGFMVQNFEAIQSDDYLKETVKIQFFKYF